MADISYKDYLGPDGTEDNMGGTSQRCFFARIADIKTFATVAAGATNPYALTVAHIMKSGKQFHQAYITQDTGELDLGDNGGLDGKSFKGEFKFFYPGFSDDAIQLANDIKNDKLLMLVELPDGRLVQLGSERSFCSVFGSFKSTTTTGRGRGFEFMATCYTPRIYAYNAAIPLTPGA